MELLFDTVIMGMGSKNETTQNVKNLFMKLYTYISQSVQWTSNNNTIENICFDLIISRNIVS